MSKKSNIGHMLSALMQMNASGSLGDVSPTDMPPMLTRAALERVMSYTGPDRYRSTKKKVTTAQRKKKRDAQKASRRRNHR